MKTLYLIRHAKSSWKDPKLTDFDRPLNKRGKKDAPFMADFLAREIEKPDLIISSPANRALTTAKIFADTFNYPQECIKTDKRIYEAGRDSHFEVISGIRAADNQVMLLGHNPDITWLAENLSGQSFGNIPTCGIVCLQFNISDWAEVKSQPGQLKFYQYPKKHN